MSINNSHYGQNGVLLYNGEVILIYYDGVELELTPYVANALMKGKKKGRIYLTSHRVNPNSKFEPESTAFINSTFLDSIHKQESKRSVPVLFNAIHVHALLGDRATSLRRQLYQGRVPQ